MTCTTSPFWFRVSLLSVIMPRSGLERGRRHRQHFAFHLQHIAGTRGARPGDFAAGPDHAAGDRHAAVDQKRHGDGGGVPAAGRQAVEETGLRRHFIGVEGLGIKRGPKALIWSASIAWVALRKR